MKPKVAIVTTEYLNDYVQDLLGNLTLDMDYSIHKYAAFTDLPALCNQFPTDIKGIITSGAFPQQIIINNMPNPNWIVSAINNDHGEVMRTILQLSYQNNSIDFNRIYADLLDVSGISMEEYILSKKLPPLNDIIAQKLSKLSPTELVEMEENMYEKHLSLWNAGEIDFSITRFSSIMPRLQQMGVPVHFPFFLKEHLHNVCLDTLQQIKMNELQANQIAILVVTPKYVPSSLRSEKADSKNLFYVLKKFAGTRLLDCVIQPRGHGFEVLTNREAVEKLTHNFKVSTLQEYIKKSQLDFPVAIGYGLGAEMHEARLHAMDANREADRLLHSASFLINEQNELIGPLKTGQSLVVSRSVSDPLRGASIKTGLSYLTLQKLAAVAKESRRAMVTSQELSLRLSVTQRTANRMLSALFQAGFAEIADLRQNTTKGRPERVYRINLNTA